MTNLTLIAVIVLQITLLVHAVIIIEKLDTRHHELQEMFLNSGIKVERL